MGTGRTPRQSGDRGAMACHVLRLETESECGACGRAVSAGYLVITDQIETPVYVVVCKGCTRGLDGEEEALQLLEYKAAVGKRTADRCL